MKNIKHIVALVMITCVSLSVQTPSAKNAIVQTQARIAQTDTVGFSNYQNAASMIQYQDGYGKPIQEIQFRGSPNTNDLVIKNLTYDTYGLPIKEHLTFPSPSNSGVIQNLGEVNTRSSIFYGDNNPFTEVTEYDHSPLSRPIEMYGAGQAWRSNSKSVTHFYEVAGANVKNYQIDASEKIIVSGNYPTNSLSQKRTIDEEGSEVIEIMDKKGRLLEKKVLVATGQYLITAYIYDTNDRLKAVIQPEGYSTGAIAFNSTAFTNYVFFYIYNDQGNVAQKHIPGGGWTSLVYDKVDRLVLSQDAHQASLDKWSFTKYDVFDRVVLEGELTNTDTQATLQTTFLSVTNPFENYVGGASIYTNQSFPITQSLSDARIINYYDTYDWVPAPLVFNADSAYNATSYFANAKALPTGSWVRSNEYPTTGFYMVMYYDDKGRPLQTYQTHHKGGVTPESNPIATNYNYNFAGEVLAERMVYKVDGLPDVILLASNEYDHVGRVTKSFHSINGVPNEELCRYTYDEIGRMIQKKILPNGTYQYQGTPEYINRPPNPNLGIDDVAIKAICLLPGVLIDTTYLGYINPTASSGAPISGLQTMDYSYHIRGMMTGINLDVSSGLTPNPNEGDLFSYKLDYDAQGVFDGNIAKQSWKGDTTSQRSYDFAYDDSKRLTTANYVGVGTENYSLPQIQYDLNGNITTLQRNGELGVNSYGIMDNLSYTYSGNVLSSVSDAVVGNHMVDLNPQGGGIYTYYPNGALKSDENEGIQNIVYDTYLRKPIEIELIDGRKIQYLYDGAGNLFKTIYLDATSATIQSWDMVGQITLNDDNYYQLPIDGGRAVYQALDTTWHYEFDYVDHLGNTRTSFRAIGNNLVQTARSSFDPWGVPLQGLDLENPTENRWELQGHERDKTFGLNRVNFGNRSYNPTIGRFDRVDRFSEKYGGFTPYHYTAGNPVNLIDINGDSTYRFDESGAFLGLYDTDIAGVRGAIGKVNKTYDEYGLVSSESFMPILNFNFNDPINDAESLNFTEIGTEVIRVFEDSDIEELMTRAEIEPMGLIDRFNFAQTEPNRKMDFGAKYLSDGTYQGAGGREGTAVHSQEPEGFIVIGNKGYNIMDAGNFMWGHAMKRLGFDYSTAKFGSQFNESFNDSAGDQRAIKKGFHYQSQ